MDDDGYSALSTQPGILLGAGQGAAACEFNGYSRSSIQAGSGESASLPRIGESAIASVLSLLTKAIAVQ